MEKMIWSKPPQYFPLKNQNNKKSLDLIAVFSAGWASYLSWFSASCRAKARSQPQLSCVSHPSDAVVGREVGSPHSWPRRVGVARG